MLLVHWDRLAASRADWTAGSKSAISTAMIAITTSNSISVKPPDRSLHFSDSMKVPPGLIESENGEILPNGFCDDNSKFWLAKIFVLIRLDLEAMLESDGKRGELNRQ